MDDFERPHVLPVDPHFPEADPIAIAADAIRAGKLVAFPTETVYGLGANALDDEAVRCIFAAKGRPADNPLIVHVGDEAAARRLAADWPAAAAKLAARFWPGPLTLVVHKTAAIPDTVTAGGATVALRCPDHPVAKALLLAAQVPIAAPSANRSEAVSPTNPAHVLAGLHGRIDFLLAAGETPGGIESTVVDVTTDPPTLLRPGPILPTLLSETLGVPVSRLLVDPAEKRLHDRALRSPGMARRHYAPRAVLIRAADDGRRDVDRLLAGGFRVGWITLGPSRSHPASLSPTHIVEMPTDAVSYGAKLYAALHALDAIPVDQIVVARIPADEDWLAINDRLDRAGGPASAGADDESQDTDRG